MLRVHHLAYIETKILSRHGDAGVNGRGNAYAVVDMVDGLAGSDPHGSDFKCE